MISQPRSVAYCGGTVSRVDRPRARHDPLRRDAAPSSPSRCPGLPPQVARRRSRARKTTPPTRVSRTAFCLMAPPMDRTRSRGLFRASSRSRAGQRSNHLPAAWSSRKTCSGPVTRTRSGDPVPLPARAGRNAAEASPAAYNSPVNVTLPTAQSLRAALAGLLDGLPPKQAAQAVDRLIASYRGTPRPTPRSCATAPTSPRTPRTGCPPPSKRYGPPSTPSPRPRPTGRPAPTPTSAAAPERRPGRWPGPGRGAADDRPGLGRARARPRPGTGRPSGRRRCGTRRWQRARIGAALELEQHGPGHRQLRTRELTAAARDRPRRRGRRRRAGRGDRRARHPRRLRPRSSRPATG